MIILFQTAKGETLYVMRFIDNLPPPSVLMENRYALCDGRFFQCQNINNDYAWEDVTGVIGIDARQSAITGIDCQYKTKREKCIVRESPTWSSSRIGIITDAGTLVDVIMATNRWCRIYANDIDGWVLSRDLEVVT